MQQASKAPDTTIKNNEFIELEEDDGAVTKKKSTITRKLKIAIVGTGAVGAYYGTRLWETNRHDVQYHIRGEHLEASKRNGLNVKSVNGDMYIPTTDLQAFSTTDEMQKADWIIVCLKSTSLDAIPDLILPLLTKETRVLCIMNGLIEKDLIRMLKEKTNQTSDGPLECCRTLYGGMALICSNRIAPGEIEHTYAGLLTVGVATTNTPIGGTSDDDDDDDDDDQKAIEELWLGSNVELVYEKYLLRGRWMKMIWNLPFNGISVAMGGITVDKIVNDPLLRELAYNIMNDTINIANAELAAIYKDEFGTALLQPLDETDKKKMMEFTDKMGVYRTSTMLDLTHQRSMEVQYLFHEPIQRAKRLGINVPYLETIVAMVAAYQREHNLY